MRSIRDYHYSTERLVVNEWNSFSHDEWPLQNLPNVVLENLSEPVTQSLPPPWQGLYTLERARQWIQERDDVASIRVLEKCGFIAEPESDETKEQLFKIEIISNKSA